MPRKPSLMTAGNIFNEVNICAIREPSKRSWRTYRNCLHTNKDSIASWNYPWIWRQKRRPLIRFSYNKIGFLIKRFTYQAHWEHILRAKYAKFNEMCLWEARYEQVFCAVRRCLLFLQNEILQTKNCVAYVRYIRILSILFLFKLLFIKMFGLLLTILQLV